MASRFRYLRGDVKPQLLKTDGVNYPIEAGDLVFRNPTDGVARPAKSLLNQGTVALNQDAFQQYFAGVALAKIGLQSGETSFKLTTDPGYVLVATEGEFEYDCESTQWTPGELVGIAATTNGIADSQKVATAASASLAIGLAVPGIASLSNAMTRVPVSIRSTIFGAGVQDQVAGSTGGSGV